MIIIQNPTRVDDELYKAILHLLPQLNVQHPIPTISEINSLLKAKGSKFFVARYPLITSPIAGMVTLAVFRVPSGVRAHIEDLVVDYELRNNGIAKALMSTALQTAQNNGAKGVTLTSHPRRIYAIKLYEDLGFKKWDTNLFYYNFDNSN